MYSTIALSKYIFRSFVPTPTPKLPDAYLNPNRSSPSYSVSVHTISSGSERLDNALKSDLLWFTCISRYHSSQEEQSVPGWSGFISLIGNKPASTTNYYEVIKQPITDLCAIQECIKPHQALRQSF